MTLDMSETIKFIFNEYLSNKIISVSKDRYLDLCITNIFELKLYFQSIQTLEHRKTKISNNLYKEEKKKEVLSRLNASSTTK